MVANSYEKVEAITVNHMQLIEIGQLKVSSVTLNDKFYLSRTNPVLDKSKNVDDSEKDLYFDKASPE